MKPACLWRASQRIDLRHDERGGVLVIVAVTFTILMGFAGLAVDVGLWYLDKAKLQTAADFAAMAAGFEMMDKSPSVGVVKQAARESAAENGVSVASKGSVSTTVDAKVVTVDVARPAPLFFTRLFLDSPPMISARAVAAVSRPPTCLLALAPHKAGSLNIGNGAVQANDCTVQVNSDDPGALTGETNGSIESVRTCVVGGYAGKSTYSPMPETGCSPLADPLAAIAEPPAGSCTATNFELAASGSATLSPGVYCGGIKSQGTLTLNPGVYFIKGGYFQATSGGGVTADGVTLVFKDGASLDIGGHANIKIKAPVSGPTAGIVFFDRGTPTVPHTFRGGGSVHYEGVAYMPNADVLHTGKGTSNASSPHFGIIANTFRFEGNGTLVMNTNWKGSSLADELGATPVLTH